MKKMLLFIALLAGLSLHNITSMAQCNGRYNSAVFTGFTVDSVIYSIPYSLKLDVYQPFGDTITKRPLIILAHGGSFISGDRHDDSTIVQLCRNFALRGYVTASIEYRLGNIFNFGDSSYVIDVVAKAMSDGKAAIRYFTKDAATVNTYRIDTDNIFIGGNSAGAVLYMQDGYIDSLGECPPYLVSTIDSNGGFEGNSGNDGYPTKFKAIINLAGALNETSFVGPGDKPSVNAQGDQDQTVPYYCGYPLNGYVHVNLCGLGSLEPVYDSNDIYHSSLVFPGDGHVPWEDDTTKFHEIDTLITNFLYSLVCTNATESNTINQAADIKIFPNPANDFITIQAGNSINNIAVYDMTGRVVAAYTIMDKTNYTLNTKAYSKGVYFIKINTTDRTSPIVKQVVIE